MKEQFLKHIQFLGSHAEREKLLLAVSGGLDSMVMAHLFYSNKFIVGVAHANFQLRGEDAVEDEQFVKDWCGQHNIPFYSKRFETNNYATAHKLSIQMAARALRYSWFEALLKSEGYRYVATAHHLNDSLETVLINLARGTGIEGMAGIPLKSGNRIRPMLFATRSEIENYAANNAIVWREDSSNQTDDYQRNFIRHQIVPVLKKLNPSIEATFKESVSKMQQEVSLLQNELEAWKERYVTFEGPNLRIDKNAFALPAGEARLWHCIRPYGFSYSQCEDVLQAIQGQSGKQFITASYKLVVDRESLIVTPVRQLVEVEIDLHQESAVLGSWELKITQTHDLTLSDNRDRVLLDHGKVTFPLIWRKWRAGDSFCPLGMTNHKKISDFLIDSKISRGEKDSITVLESAGEIIWVVGHRIDNRFKVTASSTRALSLAIHPYLW